MVSNKEVYNHGKVDTTGRPVKIVDGVPKIDYDAMRQRIEMFWPYRKRIIRRDLTEVF